MNQIGILCTSATQIEVAILLQPIKSLGTLQSIPRENYTLLNPLISMDLKGYNSAQGSSVRLLGDVQRTKLLKCSCWRYHPLKQ